MNIKKQIPVRQSRQTIQATPGPKPDSTGPSNSGETPDHVLLIYSANNVASLGRDPQPVAGSFKLLPELKAMAAETKDSRVSIRTQGYERLETGRWESRRYRIEDGQCIDETKLLDGLQSHYDHSTPAKLIDTQPGTGPKVSMFSREAVHDFLLDSMQDYPKDTNFVLIFNAHGSPEPSFGGETIVHGKWENTRMEHLGVSTLSETIAQVQETTGRSIGLLDLNTCEMGKASNALELGRQTDLLLASPQNEFVPKGHEYTAAFQDIIGATRQLIANPDLSPTEFAKTIIEQTTAATTFEERGVVENPIPTLSIFDTAKLPEFQNQLSRVGSHLSAKLKSQAGRDQVLEALANTFEFRKNVMDLRGFLEGFDEPETRELSQTINSMTVHEYSGQFRGRDYAQAGPIAVYLPQVDPDPAPVLVPEVAENLKKTLSRLHSDHGKLSPRRQVTRMSSAAYTLQSSLESDYPAMLKVVPNPELKKVVGAFTGSKNLDRIEEGLQQLIVSPDTSAIQACRTKTKTLTAGLESQIANLDIESWLDEVRAKDGENEMKRTAFANNKERRLKSELKPLDAYQKLQSLPASWKTFTRELAQLVVQETMKNLGESP